MPRFEPAWFAERQTAADKLAAEEKARAMAAAKPGQLIEGEGIILGQYQPKDRYGQSLGKIFNVFAAPQDLTHTPGSKKIFNYIDTVKNIAALKNWHGFDGTNYPTDKEIYAALKDGTYNGGWIIPPRELLIGTEPDGANRPQRRHHPA